MIESLQSDGMITLYEELKECSKVIPKRRSDAAGLKLKSDDSNST